MIEELVRALHFKSDDADFLKSWKEHVSQGGSLSKDLILTDQQEFQRRLSTLTQDQKNSVLELSNGSVDEFSTLINAFDTLRNMTPMPFVDEKLVEANDSIQKYGVYKYENMLSSDQLANITGFVDAIGHHLGDDLYHSGKVNLHVNQAGQVVHLSNSKTATDTSELRLQSKNMGFFPPGTDDIASHPHFLAIPRNWYRNSSAQLFRATVSWLHPAPDSHIGWHVDSVTNVMKAMVVLDDITLQNGPMYYAMTSHACENEMVKDFKHKNYLWVSPNTRVGDCPRIPDEEVLEGNKPKSLNYDPAVIKGEVFEKSVTTAKRGDVIFFDTSGLHSGNLCNEGLRRVVMYSFDNQGTFLNKFLSAHGKN